VKSITKLLVFVVELATLSLASLFGFGNKSVVQVDLLVLNVESTLGFSLFVAFVAGAVISLLLSLILRKI
jgi:uncharacterized integral membrane protein